MLNLFKKDKSSKANTALRKLGITSIEFLHDRYIVFCSKLGVRAMSVIRMIGRPKISWVDERDGRPDRLEYFSFLLKIRDLITGLQKRKIPFAYVVLLNPIEYNSKIVSSRIKQLEHDVAVFQRKGNLKLIEEERLNNELAELKRLYSEGRYGFFQTDILFMPWADGELQEAIRILEKNTSEILASITAVFPDMEVVRLEKEDLLSSMKNFFFPTTLGET